MAQRDVALVSQPMATIRRLLEENPFLEGAPELLRALKQRGVRVALVSAGFTLNTDPIVAEFGLDYSLANELLSADGVLEGRAVNHVPEGGKAAFARRLMAELGVSVEETLAAGDTVGDLELFECAGVRLAVNPRCDRLRDLSDAVFEPDLTGAVNCSRLGHLPWRRAMGILVNLSGRQGGFRLAPARRAWVSGLGLALAAAMQAGASSIACRCAGRGRDVFIAPFDLGMLFAAAMAWGAVATWERAAWGAVSLILVILSVRSLLR
jgi:HAD superfamily phosphoserine phosphatase-like hydrolase